MKAVCSASSKEVVATVAGVKINDLAAKPRRSVVGNREMSVAVCAAAMDGMPSKYDTRYTGR